MAERTALVTGCSGGFGLGIAQALVERGWTVLAGVRDPARAPTALEGARLLPLDLANGEQIAAVAAGIDRLDCLVNNAGYALNGPLSSYGAAQMQQQLQVNLLGPALLTQQLLPALAAARGRVINVSSLAGETGMPMNSLYCASKFALEGFSESLRHELSAH
ncbi:SDR family NAD(P)-dependent oxidoreductase, partial [Accumulibacter sp.]|uniref:SDR family NAD(P)-dependent oxidoreductase n=1 Tax=Accumulibacter sp. TaxID=2053492 RepID=UPI0028C3C1C4